MEASNIYADYSKGAVSQVIQRLLQSGVDINAKDIRVGAMSDPQALCDHGRFAVC